MGLNSQPLTLRNQRFEFEGYQDPAFWALIGQIVPLTVHNRGIREIRLRIYDDNIGEKNISYMGYRVRVKGGLRWEKG